VEMILRGENFDANAVIKIASLLPNSRFSLARKKALLAAVASETTPQSETAYAESEHTFEQSEHTSEHTTEHTFVESEHTFEQSEHTNPYINPLFKPFNPVTLRSELKVAGTAQQASCRATEQETENNARVWDTKTQTFKIVGTATCPRCKKEVTERYVFTAPETLVSFPERYMEVRQFHREPLCLSCFKECNHIAAFAVAKMSLEMLKGGE